MARHVVVGAGAIGRSAAEHLARRGHDVVIASRSGTDPGIEGVGAARVDASDAGALGALARGAAALVNATNPSRYYAWETDWPPVAAAFLAAAERSGAGLVTVSNLYGYGPVDGPLTEDLPLAASGTKGRIRAEMWRQALALHEAGRIRATEVRPSDYFGPGVSDAVSQLNRFVIRPAATGRTVWLVRGGADIPHAWSYVEDIGSLTATLATDDRAWGRPWHVPTERARTVAEVVSDAAAAAGRLAPRIRRVPSVIMALGRVDPTIRELAETEYQFDRPYLLDSTRTEETFGLRPTVWAEAIAATVAAVRGGASSPS